jgi:putative IMPACT (imprinted ancient) family translation regulator
MQDREAAHFFVEKLNAEHPGAAHVCWALLAGGHSAAVDDGEPSGTAGRPMLEVLRHQDLESVLATVVRLVRAYTDSVAQALLTAEKITLQRLTTLACSVPYAMEGWIRREIIQANATLIQVQHQASVRLEWQMPESESQVFIGHLNESGQGRIDWHKN